MTDRTGTPPPIQMSLPVYVLTGFLGSGKTTLLNRLLRDPALADTAVLVNEFGEVAIDHLLVEELSETIVLLGSGCLCCAVRGDLVDALRDLFIRQLRGEIPPIRRVVIETTGLADPAPIIHTLLTDENLRERYSLAGVLVTVDAVNGLLQLQRHEECLRQAVLADMLLLTKCDLPDAADQLLRIRLSGLNPGADILDYLPASVLTQGGRITDPAGRLAAAAPWLGDAAAAGMPDRHDPRISSFTLYRVRPIDWTLFIEWLKPVLAEHGPKILRIKGLLNVAGIDTPVVIQGVQHIFYPTTTIPRWPEGDRRTKIVFITLGLDEDVIRQEFQALLSQVPA